jgi:hypothetical protein
MSAPVITKSKIESAVANAAVDVMRQVAASAERTNARIALKATEVAARVTADPAISTALEPLPRIRSETLQGIVVAGAGWFLQATGLGETTTIALEQLGYNPDPAKVSTVLTTLLTVGGRGWAWFGRETTTRRLSGWFSTGHS